LERNFPKLIKLQFRPDDQVEWKRAIPHTAIAQLNSGAFLEGLHRSEEPVRMETLFWITDVIKNPDGIHPNCGEKVEGEEVYFRRYDKAGTDIKLVFTIAEYPGRRIVVSSFFEKPSRLHKYCGLPEIWPEQK
jgi:hypothetical protein